MADLFPFKALRYDCTKAGDIKNLTCPPYDIISPTEREEFIEKNQYNVIRLELPVGEDKYAQAGYILNEWIEKGILKRESDDCFYIYEEQFFVPNTNIKKSFKGIIGNVKIEEFSKGVVLPHEETLSKAKEDRFNLMKNTFCNFSQVYSLYMDDLGENNTETIINEISKNKPKIEFTDKENITHRLWISDNKEINQKISAQFKERKLYIADGHHRYETALNFRNYCRENGLADKYNVDRIMMMLVSMTDDGLVVLPTHRIVKDLKQFDEQTVISQSEQYFDIKKLYNTDTIQQTITECYNKDEKAFAFYTGKDYYYLFVLKDMDSINKILPNKRESVKNLDVTILHSLVLEQIMGIDKENLANQINLKYTKFIDEAISDVKLEKADCSFILNPTRVTQIRDVAQDCEKMPQKSTYFYPKIITGLTINSFRK